MNQVASTHTHTPHTTHMHAWAFMSQRERQTETETERERAHTSMRVHVCPCRWTHPILRVHIGAGGQEQLERLVCPPFNARRACVMPCCPSLTKMHGYVEMYLFRCHVHSMEDSVAGEGSVCEGRVCERVGKTLPSASKKWGGAGSVLGVGEGRTRN